MKETIEKIQSYCTNNQIHFQDLGNNRLNVLLPQFLGQSTLSNLYATFEYFPVNESLKVTCELGKAYGSRLTQALRLNNVLTYSSLSVIRKDGEDHFNLIFWDKIDQPTQSEYNLTPVFQFIFKEIEKIRPVL